MKPVINPPNPSQKGNNEATGPFNAIFRPNPDVLAQVTGEVTPQVKGQVTAEVIKMLNSISGEMAQSYLNLLSAQTALSSHI